MYAFDFLLLFLFESDCRAMGSATPTAASGVLDLLSHPTAVKVLCVIGVFVVATLVGLLIGCLMRLGKRRWTACLAASGSAFLGTAIVGFLVLNYLVT